MTVGDSFDRRLTRANLLQHCNAGVALWCNNPTKGYLVRGVGNMVGTVALVVLFTLTALAVVLYAAYCEAGEDLPCKKARRKGEASSLSGSTRGKGSSL